jgi:hypothetical protein
LRTQTDRLHVERFLVEERFAIVIADDHKSRWQTRAGAQGVQYTLTIGHDRFLGWWYLDSRQTRGAAEGMSDAPEEA